MFLSEVISFQPEKLSPAFFVLQHCWQRRLLVFFYLKISDTFLLVEHFCWLENSELTCPALKNVVSLVPGLHSFGWEIRSLPNCCSPVRTGPFVSDCLHHLLIFFSFQRFYHDVHWNLWFWGLAELLKSYKFLPFTKFWKLSASFFRYFPASFFLSPSFLFDTQINLILDLLVLSHRCPKVLFISFKFSCSPGQITPWLYFQAHWFFLLSSIFSIKPIQWFFFFFSSEISVWSFSLFLFIFWDILYFLWFPVYFPLLHWA